MVKEENKFAYRVHTILLDVFSKLVYTSIEKKIEELKFNSIAQFLCQTDSDNSIKFLENPYFDSAKKNFYKKREPVNYPNDFNNFTQNEINILANIFNSSLAYQNRINVSNITNQTLQYSISRLNQSISEFLYKNIDKINRDQNTKSIRNKIFNHICPKSLCMFDIPANIAIFQNYFNYKPNNGWIDELNIYDNNLKISSYNSSPKSQERRFLAVGYDANNNLVHSIVNSPAYTTLYEGSKRTLDFLNEFKEMNVKWMINLDTGAQDVLSVYDAAGKIDPTTKGELSVSEAINLLVYYYQ